MVCSWSDSFCSFGCSRSYGVWLFSNHRNRIESYPAACSNCCSRSIARDCRQHPPLALRVETYQLASAGGAGCSNRDQYIYINIYTFLLYIFLYVLLFFVIFLDFGYVFAIPIAISTGLLLVVRAVPTGINPSSCEAPRLYVAPRRATTRE